MLLKLVFALTAIAFVVMLFGSVGTHAGDVVAEAPPPPLPRFGIECAGVGNLYACEVYDHKTKRDYVLFLFNGQTTVLDDGK